MYPVRCEAVFNQHPAVHRTALVGVGLAGAQRPVLVVELKQEQKPSGRVAIDQLLVELAQLGRGNPLTACIRDFLIHPAFPVDFRHNAKISREKLAIWAAKKLG